MTLACRAGSPLVAAAMSARALGSAGMRWTPFSDACRASMAISMSSVPLHASTCPCRISRTNLTSLYALPLHDMGQAVEALEAEAHVCRIITITCQAQSTQTWRARRLRRPCARQPPPRICSPAPPPQVWRLNPTRLSAVRRRLALSACKVSTGACLTTPSQLIKKCFGWPVSAFG